jgi:hypothetical protein
VATPLGPEPFPNPGPDSGPGVITVLGVVPISTTEFVVVFDVPPNTFDVQAFYSGTNVQNYTLSAETAPSAPFLPATRQPSSAVATQDPDYPTQIVISADVTLEPLTRVHLDVAVTIRGENGETIAGTIFWEFTALEFPKEPLTALEVREDEYRDFDYIVTGPPGAPTQVYRFDSNDDIGMQSGRVSLQKRIYRRIFSQPGDYAWDGSYGVGVAVQALAKGGRLQELASAVAEQIRLEPDVADANAEVFLRREETGTFVVIQLAVLRTDRALFRYGFTQPV